MPSALDSVTDQLDIIMLDNLSATPDPEPIDLRPLDAWLFMHPGRQVGATDSNLSQLRDQVSNVQAGPIHRGTVRSWSRRLSAACDAFEKTQARVRSLLAAERFVQAAEAIDTEQGRWREGDVEHESLQALRSTVDHATWGAMAKHVRERLASRDYSGALGELSTARRDAALNGWNTGEHEAVCQSIEAQVLEQQARAAGALFMRSIGGKMARARPNPRSVGAAQLEAAALRVNAPPPSLSVGSETQCMVVRGEKRVQIEAPPGVEVRATQEKVAPAAAKANPKLKGCSVVSFVLVPSLLDPFETSLYGKRKVAVSVGGKPLDGSPFEVEVAPSPEFQAPSAIEVVDGQSNEALDKAAITFRDRDGNTFKFAPGERVRLPGDGAYDVTVCTDADFTPLWRRAIVSMGELRSGAPTRLMLSARLTHRDQMRVILSWGETPRDLDLHVFQRHPGSRRLAHVYYPRKGRLIEGMHLDVDVTSGFGPETVTIDVQPTSEYLFAVHNYSDDGPIATSAAKLEVYGRSGLLASFDVPAAGEGRWWDVFSLSGAAWQSGPDGLQGVVAHGRVCKASPSKKHFAWLAARGGEEQEEGEDNEGEGEEELESPPVAKDTASADGAPTLSGLVIHPDVACGRCGQEPLVGPRFCDASAHTDLCQACHAALPAAARARFDEIKTPTARSLAASSEWERGHGRHGEGLAPRRAAALAEE